MFKHTRAAITQAKKCDPSAPSRLTILLSYPGVHAVMFHQVAHFFYRMKWTGFARVLANIARFFTNIDIHPGAQIQPGLFIDHGGGTVIGQTARIGKNVVLFHGVTLGSNSIHSQGKRHPNLEDNVILYPHVTVLGNVTIGANTIVGAHTLIKKDIPPNSIVVGNPVRFLNPDTSISDLNKQEPSS